MKRERSVFEEKQRVFKFQEQIARILRILVILIASFSFLLSFRYPEHGNYLIPLALIFFVFLVPALQLWMHNLADEKDKAKNKADPRLPKQALFFLESPNALNHVFVLLDEPSLDPKYQKDYCEMLVDLGAAAAWVDAKENHIASKKASCQEMANEAYSSTPTAYDHEFLDEWKRTFEELQDELKNHFGARSVVEFNQALNENPLSFLERYKDFLLSETAPKLQNFLRKF